MNNKAPIFLGLIALILIIAGAYYFASLNNISSENNLSQEEREILVENYIKENISTLSPEEAVLGGTFMVTSVTFFNDNEVLVDYEDGHIALSGLAVYEVSGDGDVEVKKFEIIEDELNFSEIGNIVEREGLWTLVYEKPGSPALTVSLVFDDLSMCTDERADGSCLPAYWEIGDRVEIKGVKDEDILLVRSFRVIGEASSLIDSGDNGTEKLICVDMCGNGICEEMVCMGEGCPCAETPDSCPADCS